MQTLPLLVVGYVASTFIPSFAEELKLIQVLFRHGERAPCREERMLYPLDPHFNATWYPEGWCGLTNDGKRNAYELGRFLKGRYGDWLGNVYLKDDVVFRSSRFERTIMTTQLVAAGLFPPSEIQRWDSELDWQPIPVLSESSTTENLYLQEFYCPKLKAMRHELDRTDEFLLNRAEQLAEVFDYVSRNIGRNVSQEYSAYLYHYLDAESRENVELPEWTKEVFPEKLRRIASYDYIIQSYNESLIQLNGGQWIREWLENVDSYLNGSQPENPKGFFYGGHELNVAAILVTLGVFEQHVPFYCSAVIFELSEVEDELFVKVLHRNKGILEMLLIPGCGSLNCPLKTFRQLFADVIAVQDMDTVCKEN